MSSLLWAHKQLEGRGKRLAFNNERSNKKHTRITKMTDEEINATIAEACGRKRRPDGGWYPDNGSAGTQAILNYCNDLNAMHEAENTLTDANMFVMAHHIERLVSAKGQHYFHATARQRAEAFLRTLDKWEEK
jgi:hypothetical protein